MVLFLILSLFEDEIGDKLSLMDTWLETLKFNVSTQGHEISSLRSDSAFSKQSLSGLNDQVESVKQTVHQTYQMTNNLQTQMEATGISISKLNNGQNDHVATFKDIKHDLEDLNSRMGESNVVSDKKYDVLDQEILGLRRNYTQGIHFLKSVNVSLERHQEMVKLLLSEIQSTKLWNVPDKIPKLPKFCIGQATTWNESEAYRMYSDVSLHHCSFEKTPQVFTFVTGKSEHDAEISEIFGSNSILSLDKSGFRLYLTKSNSSSYRWLEYQNLKMGDFTDWGVTVHWLAVEL